MNPRLCGPVLDLKTSMQERDRIKSDKESLAAVLCNLGALRIYPRG